MSVAGEIPSGVRLVQCVTCGSVYVGERVRCRAGADHELAGLNASGDGEVFSWTVTHVPMSEWAKGRTPYVTVLVELDAGVRLLAHLDAAGDLAGAGLRIGQRVHVSAAPGGDAWPEHALLARVLNEEAGQG